MRLDDDIQFAILGPLEVHSHGHEVPIRGSRDRMVLASLLLAAGNVVSLDRLVETVWDSRPPRAAAKAVRNSVSALRQRLAGAGVPTPIIGTEPVGYRLRLDHCYLDAQDFRAKTAAARRLAAAGQAEQAAAELRAALALWRGPALTGLGSAVIEAQAASLNEQRLTALEECFDLEIALCRHRQLISELQDVAREYPLRERVAGQLMIVLYRSGRQAEALKVYRQLAAKLAEDLGIDPSAEVSRLHEAILRQEPSLDLSVRAAANGSHVAHPRREGLSASELHAPRGTPHEDGTVVGTGGGIPCEPEVLENMPSYSRLVRRRPSRKWLPALFGACALGVVVIVGASMLRPYATPPRYVANPGPTVNVARDNTDPYADGCKADKKAIDWEPVYWPSRKMFGTLVLYYSPACQAAWGYLEAPNSAAWTIHIIPDRPSDHLSVPWQFSGNEEYGSWSNVLSTRPGCVFIEAFVSSKAGTGPTAMSPCFSGTGPETYDGNQGRDALSRRTSS